MRRPVIEDTSPSPRPSPLGRGSSCIRFIDCLAIDGSTQRSGNSSFDRENRRWDAIVRPRSELFRLLREIRNGKCQAIIVLALALVLLACGCHKSAQETAEENAIKRHQQEVNGGRTMSPAAIAESNFLRSPEGQRMIHSPAAHLTESAGKFLRGMLVKGQLPGADKNTMLMCRTEGPTNYPVLRLYYAKMHGGIVNHYTVSKDDPDAPWRLQRAWRTDASSNVVQEFPVQ